MGLVRDVWSAIFGPRVSPEAAAKAARVVGQVFGASMAKDEARGLLTGILPYGQPPKRGTMELMLLYGASPWLRAVVSRIAQRIGSTEWELERIVGPDGKAMRAKALQRAPRRAFRNALRKRYAKSGMDVEPVLEHPMLDFMHAGNPKLDGRGCMQVTSTHVLLKGEGYWLLERYPDGPLKDLPSHYWPIPPFWVIQTPTVTLPGYRVQFAGWHGWIPETEIVQFTDPDPFNPYARGVGLAEALGDELDSDEYASKWIKSRFYNQGVPAALVSLKGGDEDEATRMKAKWQQDFGGFMRQFRAYFTSREIQVERLEPKFEEMKLIELRGSMRDAVLEVFGYPKELLGILTNANRSTIDTAEFRLEKYVVEPWREFFRHALQHRLTAAWDDRAVLDYVSDVPADREFSLSVMKARPYAFTNNAVRTLAGEDETDEAWGGERPPTPVAAPTESEVIPGGGGMVGGKGADPVWTRELHARRKAQEEEQDDDRAFTSSDIDDVVSAVDDDEFAPLGKILEDNIRSIGGKAMGALGLQASAFDHRDPAIKDWLEQESSTSVAGIGDTTRDDLRTALADVASDGGSVRDAAKAIRTVFADASTSRAELIAQTEMLRASGVATHTAFRQSGLVKKKFWQHGGGEDDPRDGHIELAASEPIDLDAPFVNPDTGVEMQYPGEAGDPGEDCNCHCSHWARVDDPKSAAKKAPNGAQQRGWRTKGESALKQAARVAFAQQQKAALRGLRRGVY
jgi:hypothetical protein